MPAFFKWEEKYLVQNISFKMLSGFNEENLLLLSLWLIYTSIDEIA